VTEFSPELIPEPDLRTLSRKQDHGSTDSGVFSR
jgi:hypothetical protein